MKRIVLSVLGTVIGLVGLLSFKSHGHTAVGATQLPSAALNRTGAPATSPGSSSTGAPPDPSSSPTGSASATSKPGRNYDGSAVETQYGTVQVRVAVTGTKITDVSFLQLTSTDDRSAYINSQAGPMLLQETLTAQSAKVDVISGATYTSEGYLQSLQSALDQAGIK